MRGVWAMATWAIVVAGCSAPPRDPCGDGRPLGAICGFYHPEDVEWVPDAGLVLVSNMRDMRAPTDEGGYLAGLPPGTTTPRRLWPTGGTKDVAPDPAAADPRCPGPPAAATFAPHGITVHAGRLYVVAHGSAGGREAIEVFSINGAGAGVTLSWVGCIPAEPRVIANDVAVAPDGEVVVSNYLPEASLWTTIRAGAFGSHTGDVMTWQRETGWRHLPQTAASMPNGVAVSADGAQVFYAETGTGKVYRVPRNGVGPPVAIGIGGNPDNLSWTPQGTLLVATHTGGPFFVSCALGRVPCRSPWAVFEIVPQTMRATERFAHDGSIVGAVASVTQADDRWYFGAVFDDRIGVMTVPPAMR